MRYIAILPPESQPISFTRQILDLSENKLDTVAARSLCTFLKSPTCCLTEILLAKADIDDAETAIVMEVGHTPPRSHGKAREHGL